MGELSKATARDYCARKLHLPPHGKIADELCLFTSEIMSTEPLVCTAGMLAKFLSKKWSEGKPHKMLMERIAREYCQMLAENYGVENGVMPPSRELVKKTNIIIDVLRSDGVFWRTQLFVVFDAFDRHMGGRSWSSATAADIKAMKASFQKKGSTFYCHALEQLKKICHVIGKDAIYEEAKGCGMSWVGHDKDDEEHFVRIVTPKTDAAIERLRQKYWRATKKGYKRPSEIDEYIKLVRELKKKYNT